MSTLRPPILDHDLAGWTDAAVADARERSLDRLKNAADRRAAQVLYQTVLLPLEREAVWRAGQAQRSAADLLFATVGGQADTPTQAGLRWPARHVVFLHSDKTRPVAVETAENLGLAPGSYTLRSIGTGTEPLGLYRALRDGWVERGQPDGVVVDLTGGFKTMSAAAAAAGFLIPGAQVSYVETSQHRQHGDLYWLNTTVKVLANPLEVFGDLERAAAEELLRGHRFGPAARAWRALADRTRQRTDEWRASLAEALDAGDRLQLQQAADQLAGLIEDIPRDILLDPRLKGDALAHPDALAWMGRRSAGLTAVHAVSGKADPMKEDEALAQPAMLHLIALLLGLARRRLDAGEADLAALYAYRASEGVPQRRLTLLGYNIQRFDWDRALEAAGATQAEERDRKLRHLFRLKQTQSIPPLRTTIDRSLGYQVLGVLLDDGLVSVKDRKLLIDLGMARNRSLLAHGVASIGASAAKKLIETTELAFGRLLHHDTAVSADALAHWSQPLPPGLAG